MTLTKADLVQQVYKNHGSLTKSQAVDAVEAFLRLSKGTLVSGSDLLLSRFGKFHVRDKNPRRGRNPKTGESLELDARRVGKIQKGDELVGFTRAFLYAGADSVVGSLWEISDEATSEFMSVFYNNIKNQERYKALQMAQIALLRSERFKQPFFWGAFNLTGSVF
jgi:integration host factor subunit alpha